MNLNDSNGQFAYFIRKHFRNLLDQFDFVAFNSVTER